MGAEQSAQPTSPPQTFPPRRITRQTTVSSSGTINPSTRAITNISCDLDSPTTSEGTRRSSPPLSICSDLPYVSYIDRPIGGESPKVSAYSRRSSQVVMRKPFPIAKTKRPQSTSKHNIVVVKPGAKDDDQEDQDTLRLKGIPTFLPVMRSTLNANTVRSEPDILDKFQSIHLQNICSRLQQHYNICASKVGEEQHQIVNLVKTINNKVTVLYAKSVDQQKSYASYAEQFAKIRSISQQLSRCNSLLNENIESLETLNNFLPVEDRLEPFVWRTERRN